MRTHPWIIWYAVLLHTLWACLLLASQEPYGATPLHVYNPLPRPLMAGVLLTASVLAAWAITRRQPSWQTLAALLPQQAILTASAYAAAAAVVTAHYGDGGLDPTIRPCSGQAGQDGSSGRWSRGDGGPPS
jgi:hypothetical protein